VTKGLILVAAAAALLMGLAARSAADDLTVQQIPLPISPQAAEAFDVDGRRPIDDPVTCLARSIYWEARGEGEEAMRAVAHVVANRVAGKRFPGSFCAVIKDGGERAPCQFSWWCDGRPDTAWEAEVYARAREIARQVLNGTSRDPTGGATMFHHTDVSPGWARAAKRTATIGSHVFYTLK
jgi:spore germination cell wall hydrolase CwlJ-like protein